MALYNFHRVLIAAAILFFLAFAVYAFRRFGVEGGNGELAMGVGAAVVAAAGVGYLIYFNFRIRALRARGELR